MIISPISKYISKYITNIIKISICFCLTLLFYTQVFSKDLGKQGSLFKIKEKNLIESMLLKLKGMEKSGEIKAHQKKLLKRVVEKVHRPNSVDGLIKAQVNRVYLFDPTLRVLEDIKDHQDNIIVRAGTSINPLDTLSFGKDLVFFDGDDKEQLSWAINHHKEADFILVKGAPIELSGELKRRIYFDQGGSITNKFAIKAIPAVVSQKGKKLQISEVVI